MKMTQSLVLALCLAVCLAGPRVSLNEQFTTDRPIIGIFAYPSEFYGTYPSSEYNYLSASYVKWAEESGARTMPIPYDLSENELTEIFELVNGLIFPGGFWNVFEDQDNEVAFTQSTKAAITLLRLAKQANDDGEYFPVFGIQSGMSLIVAALASDATGQHKLFDKFSTDNLAGSLKYMRNATDPMWSLQRQDTLDFTEQNDAVLFYSNYTLSVVKFLRSDILRETFDITAMSKDKVGQQFVSAIEAKQYPIYGTYFFTQASSFEWKEALKLNHHPRTVDFCQQLSNFFVLGSRKSSHTYELTDDEDVLLTYNFETTKIKNDYFEQIYFLKKGEIQKRLGLARKTLAIKRLQKSE